MHWHPVYFMSQASVGPSKDQDVKRSQLIVHLFLHGELDPWLNTVEAHQEMSEVFFSDYKGVGYILEPTYNFSGADEIASSSNFSL